MKVEIETYMTPLEIREEIREVITKETEKVIRSHFQKETDIRRVLDNTAYEIVYKMVDTQLNEKLEAILAEKVTTLVKRLDLFHIFKTPDAWDREPNSMYSYVQKCIEDNKPIIKARIEELVDSNLDNIITPQLQEAAQYDIALHILDILGFHKPRNNDQHK